MNDPIIEEIHQLRDDHAKRFNYDLDAVCEDYMQHQLLMSDRLVRLTPKIITSCSQTLDHTSGTSSYNPYQTITNT